MNTRSVYSCVLTLCLAFLILLGTSVAQGGARARFVHVSPGASAIDVYVNSQLVVADLDYGAASSYLNVPAGTLDVVARLAGTSTLAFGQSVNVSDGTAVSMVAGSAASGFQAIPENLGALEFGTSRLYIVYAIADGPAIDVVDKESGQQLGEDVEPGGLIGPYELDADAYDLAVVPADGGLEATMVDLRLVITAGSSHLAIVHGNSGSPAILTTSAATAGSADSGLVRFLHAVRGATPVDLLINDRLIVPSLSFASPTQHLALPSGSHRVALSVGGTEISSKALNVVAGGAQTVVVMGSPAVLTVSAYADDLNGIDRSSSMVSVINAIPGSTVDRLTLSSGATAATNVTFASGSGSAKIVTGSQSLAMDLTIGDDSGTVSLPANHFYGGSYYNLIALPGSAFSSPTLLIAETSVLRGLEIETMMTETEAEMDSQVDEIQAVALTAADVDGPSARVNLNRGVNLQLRQYPHSGSLSLGLAPTSSTLIVLGRRGLTEYFGEEPADEPVDLSDFDADPAAGLERFEDLNPEETWLYVTYMTPDGGSINAWVNALYLVVTDEDGEPQRLADLEMIRQNQAGAAAGTSIGPPQPIERISARAYNLNVGVNLNIRMANNASTENLGQVQAGMPLDLVGLDESDDWAYVHYRASDDVTISGWVSAEYVQILLDGNPISLEVLREIDASLVALASDGLRGGFNLAGDAVAPPAPTKDPFLGAVAGTVDVNPDANLHLRIRPNASTESLNLVPSGTRLLVDGVTSNGEWYKVTYEDEQGWVSANYLLLSLNNRFLPEEELESRLMLFDEAGNEMTEEQLPEEEMSDDQMSEDSMTEG